MSRLDLIDDWIETVRESRYDARQLAKLCGVTDRHLRRYFIQNTGGPTRDWLSELRMWIAVPELLRPNRTIAEVSYHCEFTSPCRFCEHFRWFIRRSPTRFRTDPSVIRKLLSRVAFGETLPCSSKRPHVRTLPTPDLCGGGLGTAVGPQFWRIFVEMAGRVTGRTAVKSPSCLSPRCVHVRRAEEMSGKQN